MLWEEWCSYRLYRSLHGNLQEDLPQGVWKRCWRRLDVPQVSGYCQTMLQRDIITFPSTIFKEFNPNIIIDLVLIFLFLFYHSRWCYYGRSSWHWKNWSSVKEKKSGQDFLHFIWRTRKGKSSLWPSSILSLRSFFATSPTTNWSCFIQGRIYQKHDSLKQHQFDPDRNK